MGVNPATPSRQSRTAAHLAYEIIELLEVLWERGRDAVSPAPVSTSQLRVMYVLDRDSGINLRTLGDLLGSAPSSVSRMCDRLEALGFVERAASPVSRREVELRLTSHGETYLTDLRARREEALLAAISGMPPSARKALVDGLRGFRSAVGEAAVPHREQDGSARSA
ncbi:MarR family transcriptional regulator [Streptomyces sp. TRM 70351]|uniref:MarR family winged helix-turn-helix transcriptional regulator n=1 Tax=Streptomyces sp. TRM 70351 TaxID=3116552 RepID=UPI002E7B4A85|nr:MarR family transcriptional regulator [Streptomyces sp. TRM 70351]MEE1927091.1 MarR family transcriptional regulator [Streptomyces sp. TRM 70351]